MTCLDDDIAELGGAKPEQGGRGEGGQRSGYPSELYGTPTEIYATFSGYLISPVFQELPGRQKSDREWNPLQTGPNRSPPLTDSPATGGSRPREGTTLDGGLAERGGK
ncbi:hypothetical protein ACOMHN_057201 [Nucella lapillus]